MSENSELNIKEISQKTTKLPPLVQKKIIQKVNIPLSTYSLKTRNNIISPLSLRDENTIETTSENSKFKTINSFNSPIIQRTPSNDILKIKRNNILIPIDAKKKISNNNTNFIIKLPKININKKKSRTDRNGIEINHNNKKNVKITFIDQIENIPLCEIIEIESLKKYNYISGQSEKKEIYVKDTCCSSCNII